MPNVEVWIVDEEDRRVAPNVVGELVAREPTSCAVTGGFLKRRHGSSGQAYTPGAGSLHRRSLRMDEEGYLYFMGRKRRCLQEQRGADQSKGDRNCLCSMEGVAEAAVIGVPDEILGQAIVAYVRCAEGWEVTEKKVLKHCQIHLEDFMVPSVVRFIPAILKTANSKIDNRPQTGLHGRPGRIPDEHSQGDQPPTLHHPERLTTQSADDKLSGPLSNSKGISSFWRVRGALALVAGAMLFAYGDVLQGPGRAMALAGHVLLRLSNSCAERLHGLAGRKRLAEIIPEPWPVAEAACLRSPWRHFFSAKWE